MKACSSAGRRLATLIRLSEPTAPRTPKASPFALRPMLVDAYGSVRRLRLMAMTHRPTSVHQVAIPSRLPTLMMRLLARTQLTFFRISETQPEGYSQRLTVQE